MGAGLKPRRSKRVRVVQTPRVGTPAGATYVYCVIASGRMPSLRRMPAGVPGARRVRLLAVDRGLTAVVSSVPSDAFGESAIERGLKDLTWVSANAVGHERVVEAFLGRGTVVPMKLLTIFSNDDRAVEHILQQRRDIDRVIEQLKDRVELGVRVVLAAPAAPRASVPLSGSASGASYLRAKKAQHDRSVELGARAQERVQQIFETLAAESADAVRRPIVEVRPGAGRVLLDAAYLVPERRTRRFESTVRALAKRYAGEGYEIATTGPWPAYNFIGERR
jgi:gas vesicle protein GvpL/GvpF